MVAVTDHGRISALMRTAREEHRMDAGLRMGANESRFRPPPALSSATSLDYQIRDQSQLQRCWATANQLIVDAPLVRTALEQRVAMSRIMDWNPKPGTSSAKLNTLLKAHWHDHANDPKKCDVYAKQTFAELSASALLLHAAHGDVVAPITEHSAIKVCEAWRMRSPRYTAGGNRTDAKKWGHLGVVKTAEGQAIGYWLTREQLGPLDMLTTEDVELYDALDEYGNSIFLHPMAPGRPSTRGISMLAPVADLLYMQMDLLFTKLVQEQVASCVMFARETSVEGYDEIKKMFEADPTAKDQLAKWFDKERKTFKASPGAMMDLFPGQTLHAVSTNISPQNFVALNEFMILCLAVNLDCPALAITLDATKANFSQFRNVVHQSRMRFECLHQWWTPQWHKPVYEHVLRRVATEAMRPGAKLDTELKREIKQYFDEGGTIAGFLACEWSYPEYEYIEPVKDITAEVLARAEGSDTDEEWCSQKKGRSWTEFAPEMVSGRRFGIRLAIAAKYEMVAELESQFPGNEAVIKEAEGIPWSVFLPIPIPKAYQPILDNQPDPAPAPVVAVGGAE